MGVKDVLPIAIRNSFSERNNIEKLSEEIQLKKLDDRTRIGILNMWSKFYEDVKWRSMLNNTNRKDILRLIITNVYNQPAPTWSLLKETIVLNEVEKTIRYDKYNKVFDLLEYTISMFHSLKMGSTYRYGYQNNNYFSQLNKLFEQEFVGYRFIDNKISKISDPIEVKSINDTFSVSYDTVKGHILKANVFLSDRDNPDYQNSIKESLSALEALAQIITGINGAGATLGKMLKKLEDDGIISGAMKSGFSALYGFASEGKGIRHSSVNGTEVGFEEAKFILVISTAFINFVMAKKKD